MFLLINTTEDKSQLALAQNHKILAYKIFEANFAHSEKLLPEITKLLKLESLRKQGRKKKAAPGFSLCDLEAIIVITGPGTFTGCRVGVATANALAFSLNIPVVGINKFEIFKNLKEKNLFSKKVISKIIQIACKKLKIEKIAAPFYEKPPHITKPKPII